MRSVRFFTFFALSMLIFACSAPPPSGQPESALALEVKNETLRSWQSYKQYAWGHDVLAPISKSYKDWYEEPLYISPIDAYSTLFIMGFQDEAKEIDG
jgi:hypothetical protein